jgi:hypothetical protein
MRKEAVLAGALIGGYAMLRAARTSVRELVGATSVDSAPVAPDAVEKVKALADLGRERMRDVIDQVIGGNAGHAA